MWESEMGDIANERVGVGEWGDEGEGEGSTVS